ncbi:Ig-like domain-containing protein, partial [Candidatus Peregrinibacteria bacterium]|nr:Ig-like domain-containing protein [Candidatus Peregrinibacteria bacterium]
MKEKLRHYSHHVSRFFRTKIFWASATLLVLVGGLFLTYALIPNPSLGDGLPLDEVRKLSTGAPFTFHFTQSMDQASVESAFSMNPMIEGRFEWPDSKTLQFVPSQPLSIGETYTVTIGASSRNWARKTLEIDARSTFVISGPPTVKFISPYQKPLATEAEPIGFVQGQAVTAPSDFLIINPHQPVTVMFDRPMRALTALAELPATPLIEIAPPVKGNYRWIGTTAFQFVPDEWTMGTVYTLTLPKGIVSLDGSSTQDDTVWTLATEAPRILETKPLNGSDVFPVSGAIELTFNQPMELDYVKPSANILLYPSNDSEVKGKPKNDGFFNTEVVFGKDKDGKVDRRILVFKPEFKYQYDTAYKLVVKAGLAGAAAKMGQGYGARLLESDFELNFKTTKLPGIAGFVPKSGEQNFAGGTIVIDFDSPMTQELVAAAATLSPKADKDPEIYVTDEGRHVELWYPLKPSTSYSFSFKAPFKDAVGNTAQKGFKTFFKTAPLQANVNLLVRNNFGLFTKGLIPTYPVKVLNATTLDVELCPVGEQEFFQVTKNYRWYEYRCPHPKTATVEVKGTLNESKTLNLDLKTLFDQDFGSGFYFFQVSSPQYLDYGTQPPKPVRLFQTFMVSDTALTLKRSGQDLLVWATDLVTGKPVSRMDLKVVSEGGDELLTGVTDGNGLFKITKDLSENVFVIGRKTLEKEDRWAVTGQYWDEGIQSWQFNANGQWISLDEPRIYLYTDRPLYRPGDEVFFKGIYRLDHDADLSLPADKVVQVTLQDPDYNDADSKKIPVLADGSFNGSFKLSDKARLGQFGLYAETTGKNYPQRFYANFFVEEYKKPKFKVELLLPKTDLVLGDKIPVDVVAGYYFGGAIQEGKLHWSLMRDSTYFDRYKGQDFFSFGVWEMFECFWSRCGAQDSRIVAEGDGILDSNGRLHLELPTDQEAKPGVSYLYTLNVEIQNKDGEFVTARDSAIVHQASLYVGLGIKNYIVQPSESALVKVITVSDDGTPISGKRVTLELFREEWNVVKKQGVDGSFYDESVRTLKSINKKSVTTGAEPVEASFDINEGMDGGRYVIQGRSTDNGRETLSETNFYVSSGSWVQWGGTNNNRMTLVADKPEYFVGGKARVLIQSPFGTKDNPAKALVTTERGTLRSYEVIDITSNSQTIEVPIKDTMAPNIYVSVLVMKDASASFKAFTGYDGWRALRSHQSSLNTSIDQLKGEISTLQADTDAKSVNRNAILISKKRAEMEKLSAELSTTMESLKTTQDQEPQEVSYELAKPDFRMGVVNLRVNRREHEIQIDLKSAKPDYRAGETAEIEIHTRDFQNRPVRSTLSLAVVDESLLALKANTNMNPLDYFLGARALQVSTSSNLTLHVDRVNVGAGKGSKGGDGGGAAEGANRKRGDFKDTAY